MGTVDGRVWVLLVGTVDGRVWVLLVGTADGRVRFGGSYWWVQLMVG